MKRSDTYTYRMGDNLYINLTNRCQNRCEFCLRKTADGILGNTLWLAAEPTAQQVIADIRAAQPFSQAVFCGYGEPTMAADVLVETAAYLKSVGAYVRLNTNGLAGKEIVPRLAGLVDCVSVSLNAGSAKTYDAVCRPSVADAFDRMLEFARACKTCGMDVRFTAVDTVSAHELDLCRQIAEREGIPLSVRAYIADNENYR